MYRRDDRFMLYIILAVIGLLLAATLYAVATM